MSIPIALQLYSIREDCARDLIGCLSKVAEMGYQGVEFAGYHGHSAADLRAALDANNLVCEGAHVGLSLLDEANFDSTVAFHKELGCPWLIVPWMPESMHSSVEATKQTAEMLTELVGMLAEHGLRTGFHAHQGDMVVLENGQTAWDILAENTPAEFIMQYDTANGMSGGADPVQPIRNWPGRAQSLHLKEWSGEHGAKVIGEGVIPWADVFDAAENGGGTEWYVVEHESYDGMTALEAVDKCLENLRGMGK